MTMTFCDDTRLHSSFLRHGNCKLLSGAASRRGVTIEGRPELSCRLQHVSRLDALPVHKSATN